MKNVFVQNIIESMSIGLLVINTEGEIITTNNAAETILGFNSSQLKAQGWAELFFDKKGNLAFNQIIVDVIEHQALNQLRKVPYIQPDGVSLFLSVTSSFLHDKGKPVGIVLLFDDVTEVHELHEREKNILREKNRLHRERNMSLKLFASSIAHQIRNPASTIGGFAHRMLKKVDPECPNTDVILSEVERLEKLVRVVEEYTSIAIVEKTIIPLTHILDTVLIEMNATASGLAREIEWDIDFVDVSVYVDPVYFRRALKEILLNSIESFEESSGIITIRAHRKPNFHTIEIADSGPGIEQENLAFVFDPFYTTKVANTGMGLCLAHRIITEHNGKIRIESVRDAGTAVFITLPVE